MAILSAIALAKVDKDTSLFNQLIVISLPVALAKGSDSQRIGINYLKKKSHGNHPITFGDVEVRCPFWPSNLQASSKNEALHIYQAQRRFHY